MRLKCSKAGQSIYDDNGFCVACLFCEGIIEVIPAKVRLAFPIRGLASFPRQPMAPITCPALLADPTSSPLVETEEG